MNMPVNAWRPLLPAVASLAAELARSLGGAFRTTLLPAVQPALGRLQDPRVVDAVLQALALLRAEAPNRVASIHASRRECQQALDAFLVAEPGEIAAQAQVACDSASRLCGLLERCGVPAPIRRDLGTIRSALRALFRHQLPNPTRAAMIAEFRALAQKDPTDHALTELLWHLETRGGR